ncbi:hypothetical protein ACFPN7_25880 [Amycolatopsis halotolerans]|uniref:hypothetical protein n=1 Tax=Amycolatopsis halotolerans TaxID=330083 RepID=UPI003623BA31
MTTPEHSSHASLSSPGSASGTVVLADPEAITAIAPSATGVPVSSLRSPEAGVRSSWAAPPLVSTTVGRTCAPWMAWPAPFVRSPKPGRSWRGNDDGLSAETFGLPFVAVCPWWGSGGGKGCSARMAAGAEHRSAAVQGPAENTHPCRCRASRSRTPRWRSRDPAIG